MGERVLTVRDRIIVHLSVYNRFADDFECPEEMCQSGISEAINKSRAHVTLELNRMKSDGLVSERVAHVNGAKSRRKTYSLTQSGSALNADITGYLESMNIEIIDSEGSRIFSGTGAAEYLRANFKMLHVTAVDRIIASRGILNVKAQPPSTCGQTASGEHLPPRPAAFVARKELAELKNLLEPNGIEIIVLLGMPGIGKTALLSELAWQMPEDSVYFRRLYSYDTLNSVLVSMGDYMHRYSKPSLHNYLANSEALDLPEAATHLAEFLRQRKLVLIYDEYDQASVALKDFFTMLVDIMKGTGSKLVLASSTKPKLYGQKNIVLEKRICEITLAPLDAESSALMFRNEAVGSRDDRNVRLAGGHPLTLKLLASGMPVSNLAEFIESEILGGNPDLAKLSRFASVLRKPFIPDDLELLGLGSASDIRENPAFEKHPNGGFLLHPAISIPLKEAVSKRMMKEMHRTAAQFYLDADEDLHEAIYHLAEAGELERAKDVATSRWDELSDSGDREGLAGSLESLAGKSMDWKMMELAANAYDQAGKWARAAELAEKIEKGAPETPEAFRAIILTSKILAKTGKTGDAITALDSIIKSGKQLDSDIAGQAHYAKACALRRLDRLGPALKECEKALAISHNGGNRLLQSRSQMECAMILNSKGQHQTALEKLAEVGNAFEQLNRLQDRIRLGINRGLVLKSLGRNEEATSELEMAVKLAEDAGLSRLRAHGLANLTELLNIKKDYRRSAELAKQATDIFSVLGEPVMIAASKFNLGTALAGLGRKKEAILTMDEAVSILEKNGLTKARAAWIGDYAEILNGLGEEGKAARLLDKD